MINSKQWLALKASAGSGKTFSLAMRYISLLLSGANPNEILTLTFTKKAATEMKKRIHDNLLSLKQNKNAQNLIDELQKEYDIDIEKIKKNIPLIYQKFLNANIKIMTIDSFLQSILKKFCWYAGVSNHFKIEFEDEDKIYENFLSSLKKNEFKDFLKFCADKNIVPKNLLKVLFKMSFEHFDLKNHISDADNIDFNDIFNLAEKIQNTILKEKNASDLAKKAIKLKEYQDFDSFIATSLTWLEKGTDYRYFQKLDLSSVQKDFDILRELVKQGYQRNEVEILSKISIFLELYKKNRAKTTNKALSFSFITFKTYELMHKNDDLDFFYFRLDDKITHILIDEFQDTNIIQYKILKPLIDEIHSGEGRFNDRSIFFVGDTKQGIYRFRGSNAELFDIASKNITQKNLQYNYRSSKNIIKYVNKVFETKIENYLSQNFPENKFSHTDGFVKICPPEEDIYNSIWNNLELMLQNNIPLEDITILCFKNEDVSNIRDYLLSKNPNLPIIAESNGKLEKQNESKVIIHSIAYSKTKSEFHKKSAYKLAGFHYDEDIQMPMQEDFTTPQAFILKIIETFGLYGEAAQKMLEISCDYDNLEDFCDMIVKLQTDFAFEIKKGLQIMTIHKSKGLEFPYVILCDRFNNGANNTDRFIFEYEGIELKKIFYKQENRNLFDEDYSNAEKNEKDIRNKEEINVLYVAFTRAIEGLIIIQKISDNKKKSAFGVLELTTEDIGTIRNYQKIKNKKIKPIPIVIEQKNFGRQIGFIKQEENLQQYNSADIIFGQALHKALEYNLGYNITEEKVFHILTNEYGYFLAQKDIQYILHLIQKLKKNEVFKSIIRQALVKSEISYLDSGSLNRIDAILFNSDNKIFILDYKSGIKNQDKHKEQVKKYLEFCKTQWKDIEAYVLYVREKIEFIPVA